MVEMAKNKGNIFKCAASATLQKEAWPRLVVRKGKIL